MLERFDERCLDVVQKLVDVGGFNPEQAARLSYVVAAGAFASDAIGHLRHLAEAGGLAVGMASMGLLLTYFAVGSAIHVGRSKSGRGVANAERLTGRVGRLAWLTMFAVEMVMSFAHPSWPIFGTVAVVGNYLGSAFAACDDPPPDAKFAADHLGG